MINRTFFCWIFFFFLFIEPISSEIVQNPKILIKMPTRSRAQKFFETLNAYYDKLSKQLPYHFVISCDIDDKSMNNSRVREMLSTFPNLSVYFGNNKSKIEACNADIAQHLDFDILILASDDMIPIVDKFDLIIFEKMKEHFPNYDGVLHFNDGFQKERLNTMPIMGNNYYNRFGYIYHPAYVSLWCDNEFTDVANYLQKSCYIPIVLFEHRHPAWGKAKKDALYFKNDSYWFHDKATYEKRKKENFDLKSNY